MAARSVSTFACQYNDFSSQRKMLENCLASARVEGFARISGAPIAATWAAAAAAAAGSTFLPVFLFVFPYIPVYFPPPAHPHFPQQRLSVLHCIWAEISGGIAPERGPQRNRIGKSFNGILIFLKFLNGESGWGFAALRLKINKPLPNKLEDFEILIGCWEN